jgi:outer membrane protein insertion porin family
MNRKLLSGLMVALFVSAPAFAFEPFVVKDIRVEGIQRTEAGTVFNYLPVKVGETFTEEQATEAIRALYATGFFRDVRIDVEGGVIVVQVQERPAIAQIDFVGVKEFDKEALKKGLRDVGLAESRIFDRSLLERAEQELKRQYLSRGHYAAQITTTVTPLERNRVGINFKVDEGDIAKIRQIKIVGAHDFKEKQLLDLFPRLAHVVHQERTVFAPEALGRPREPALVLPQSRLPRLQCRFHPGLDHARQEGHLHHHQHHRRAGLLGLGGALHGRSDPA